MSGSTGRASQKKEARRDQKKAKQQSVRPKKQTEYQRERAAYENSPRSQRRRKAKKSRNVAAE